MANPVLDLVCPGTHTRQPKTVPIRSAAVLSCVHSVAAPASGRGSEGRGALSGRSLPRGRARARTRAPHAPVPPACGRGARRRSSHQRCKSVKAAQLAMRNLPEGGVGTCSGSRSWATLGGGGNCESFFRKSIWGGVVQGRLQVWSQGRREFRCNTCAHGSGLDDN